MKAETTLVIMAAGIGSRYGGGVKQLEKVGPNGEVLMQYSIYDAVKAGFDNVVFIIRREIEKDFWALIGEKAECLLGKDHVHCVYQELSDIPKVEGYESLLAQRQKPWGTGQAILACKGIVTTPFAVINADDFYGRDAFEKVHDYLVEHANDQGKYCMAGFILKNTLSENGAVTRGVCQVNDQMELSSICETKNIVLKNGKANASGKELDMNAHVSMNMWGLTPEFINVLSDGFEAFLKTQKPGDTGEYLLPTIIGELLEKGKISVRVLETKDRWFGVTYAADKAAVVNDIAELIENGRYPEKLF